jgi:hypothetical protein
MHSPRISALGLHGRANFRQLLGCVVALRREIHRVFPRPPMSPLVNQIKPKILLETLWSVGGRWRWHPILNTPTLFALRLHQLTREKLKIQDGK